MRLRFHMLLKERQISPYRLWKESGMSKNTVYALAADDPERTQIDMAVLARAIKTVARLTGPVELKDVFEL